MTVATTETEEAQSGGTKATRLRLRELGRLVAYRVTRLQETRSRSTTVASLAHLRKNLGREPGTDPTIWPLTVDGVPGVPDGDDPTRQERAVHAAMTLYALHQQSRPTAMHRPGVGLGVAVRQLERKRGGGASDGETSPVRRRFDAVVTAATLGEVTHHLRGLITQMKGADVGLDYGLLTDDLDDVQRPLRVDGVRRRWARQLYQLDRDDQTAEAAETEETQ